MHTDAAQSSGKVLGPCLVRCKQRSQTRPWARRVPRASSFDSALRTTAWPAVQLDFGAPGGHLLIVWRAEGRILGAQSWEAPEQAKRHLRAG